MKDLSPLRRTVGLVLLMIGGFWIAISLGFLEESFMTGQPVYTVVGGVVVLAGLLVLLVKPKPGVADDPAPDATTQDSPPAGQPE
jgi:drug/metabolite transporter superfamily protein YnfA